jgi:hypothetical protein
MVQSNVIMFGWNRAVPGREGMASELFAHTVNCFDKWKASGMIESCEPMFLANHGGDLNGFFLIKGNHTQLMSLKCTDEWVDIQLRASQCLTGVGAIEGYCGAQVPEVMTRWTKVIPPR